MKLLEKPQEISLQHWNEIQISLWSEIIQKGYAKKDDIEVFLDFGKFIDQFYRIHNFFPSSDEILIDLGLT